ncbi:MAG: hypothetical protein ACRCYU_02635, partial [Nocardioides sp.]
MRRVRGAGRVGALCAVVGVVVGGGLASGAGAVVPAAGLQPAAEVVGAAGVPVVQGGGVSALGVVGEGRRGSEVVEWGRFPGQVDVRRSVKRETSLRRVGVARFSIQAGASTRASATEPTVAMSPGVVSTLAGDGSVGVVDGTGSGAGFGGPRGMHVVGGFGYVFDSFFLRRVDVATGATTTVAGD